MKNIIYLIIISVLTTCQATAQESFEDLKKRIESEFSSFRAAKDKEFNDFRDSINAEYASMIKKSWKDFNTIKGIPVPDDDKPVPPVIYKDDDRKIPIENKPIPFEDVVPAPQPIPQPQPIDPIEEIPVTPVKPVQPSVSFTFFGTIEKVRFDRKDLFRLRSLDEDAIANAWLKLSEESYTNLIYDCLDIRRKYELCDWAYLMMLRNLSETMCGAGTDESVLMAAYVYCQSGYQMRLAVDNNKLLLLVATRHLIFEHSYFVLDGKNYYPILREGESISDRVHICEASFPKEKAMSLLVTTAQNFTVDYSNQRTIKSRHYPEVSATVKINQNLISFYSTYPTSMLDENIMTRWAMYANTPMAKDVAGQLYPQLGQMLDGKSQLEAVSILLDWVQTGFVYEYDDKVWGGDRAFFAEESLNYPYCDCEDRSILFTRLVRDLLGLKCILIYYPGHLAAAVRFTVPANGDYIQLNGQKYIVTDPTYIGAQVGMTMPDMDNKTAKVILLE